MTTNTKPAEVGPVAGASRAIAQVEREMNAMFLEREGAIRGLLASLLARQHAVLLGDPGTGKSALIDELCHRVSDGTNGGLSLFSYLMTKFTQTDELFGPVSFSGMKNETFSRVTTGRLPEAEIAFLDEVWKSSSAILNALLKMVNERMFTNGTSTVRVPLMSVFAASNELPDGDDLEAIRDRFLLTHVVSHLSETNFELLMLRQAGLEPDPFKAPKTTLARTDLLALQAQVTTVKFTRSVISALSAIRRDLLAEGIVISERRNGQCLRLLAANAVVESRDEVSEDDLPILIDALWREPAQQATVRRIVNAHSNPISARAAELKDEADEVYTTTVATLEAKKDDRAGRTMAAAEGAAKLQKVLEELTSLAAQGSTASAARRIEQAQASAQKQHGDLLRAVGFKMNL